MSTDSANSFISGAKATATLVDNDVFSISLGSPQITEGGALSFNPTMVGALDTVVFLPWTTSAGTAVSGTDYQAASGILPLQGAKVLIAVRSMEDDFVEANETLSINFDTSWFGTLASRIQISGNVGTILNDDTTQLRVVPVSIDEGGSGKPL